MKNQTIARISIIGLGFLALGLSACATQEEPKVGDWGIHNQGDGPLGHGNDVAMIPPPPPPPLDFPAPPPLQPPVVNYSQPQFSSTTYLAGCTGEFFLADAQSGRLLSSGRAYDAPEGLYVLDTKGQRTGKVINATMGQSLLFRPDCNCGKGVGVPIQTTAMPLMNSGAMCPNN